MNIEVSHLKYFYYAVVEGGMQGAAERLCVQQPVVSKMIRKLEDELGQPLLRKQGRKKAMTDFGQHVFRHCQVIFSEFDRIAEMGKSGGSSSGPLNIGGSEMIVSSLLPRILRNLKNRYPSVHPNIYCSPATHLMQMIALNKMDIGLFFHIPQLIDNAEIFHRIPFRFRLVALASKSREKKVLSSFIGSREIDDTSTQKFPTLEKLRRKVKGAKIEFSSNHFGLHKKLVLDGVGVSVLPEFMIREELKRGRLSDVLPREKLIFDLKVVKLKARPVSILVDQIIDELEVAAEI